MTSLNEMNGTKDFLQKDLVCTFAYTDANKERSYIERERQQGHDIDVYGRYAATTAIALIYDVYDHSDKLLKTTIHIGMSRQDETKGDVELNLDEEYEKAYINALMDPVCIVNLDAQIDDDDITDYCKNLVETALVGINKKMLFTREDYMLHLLKVDADDRYGMKYPNDRLRFAMHQETMKNIHSMR